jgi:hypothetical protein
MTKIKRYPIMISKKFSWNGAAGWKK